MRSARAAGRHRILGTRAWRSPRGPRSPYGQIVERALDLGVRGPGFRRWTRRSHETSASSRTFDHGKTTLSDRLLQETHTVSDRMLTAQYLDSMDLEKGARHHDQVPPVTMIYEGQGRPELQS